MPRPISEPRTVAASGIPIEPVQPGLVVINHTIPRAPPFMPKVDDHSKGERMSALASSEIGPLAWAEALPIRAPGERPWRSA